MKLNTLRLRNFRCFKDAQIDLNKELTVLVANNGAGKTTILDAIAVAFGAYLTRLPQVKGRSFGKNDFSVTSEGKKEPFMAIAARLSDESYDLSKLNGVEWSRSEKRDQTQKTAKQIRAEIEDSRRVEGPSIEGTQLKRLNAYADHFTDALNNELTVGLPILAYYGTGRGVFDIPERRRGFGKNFERLDAYTQCLDPKTNFRKFFEYFYFLEDAERREKEERQSFDHRKPELEVIRLALNRFLKDFSNPHTKTRPLRFLLEKEVDGEKETFNIEMLSDGYRTSIAMVMDIASRMAEANPHLGIAALGSSGIVMIDEVDMHLHPKWQQTIIADLRRTFPKIQFICSTHSPQVLSTVEKKHIRVIQDDHSIAGISGQTEGSPSHEILSMVMEVDETPDLPIAQKLSLYKSAIAAGQELQQLASLRRDLVVHYGEFSTQIKDCDRLIRLQAFKSKLALAEPNQD